jgi:hypothetical protein
MQHLIDFIHEYCLDQRLFIVVAAGPCRLELRWDRLEDANLWKVGHEGRAGSEDRVARDELLSYLERRGCDFTQLEDELRAILATHVVVAQQVLDGARATLGSEAVESALAAHSHFAGTLARVVQSAMAPRLSALRGEGKQTAARTGHLSLVRELG